MMRLFRIGFSVLVFALLTPALALAASPVWTQTTASYTLRLQIGPLANMLMPSQAAGAKSGEVMVQMPGMAMPQMTMTDNGHPVTAHLELHLTDRATGKVVTNQVPTISIRNDSTGAVEKLTSVAPMYDVSVGMSDYHFGNNAYMPAGTYTIVATVNGQTATFNGVKVDSMPTTPMAMQPATLPNTGDAPGGWLAILLAGGVALVGSGLAMRRAVRR